MPSLYDYIPKYPMHIQYGSYCINISGVYKFEIEVDRCKATYSVWVDTVQVDPLLPPGKRNMILLSSHGVNEEGSLCLSETVLPCKIIELAYQSKRHGYIVLLECVLSPKFLTKFKYIEPGKEKKEEMDRFGLMDL